MITADDIASGLRGLGVAAGDTVFVHSGLHSALRVEGRTATEKLDTILAALDLAVGEDGAVILPTFTYSFTAGEPFDVAATPSTVGALTEHFRARDGVWRTTDPIFSSAVRGDLAGDWKARLRALGDKDCFGPASVFAYLAESGAKLVFVGVGFEYCTFVHHVEQDIGVPYRYLKEFRGTVTDGDRSAEIGARYFVRRLDEDVETDLAPLGERLLAAGAARADRIPRGPSLLVAPAPAVATEARAAIAENPDFMLTRGHR